MDRRETEKRQGRTGGDHKADSSQNKLLAVVTVKTQASKQPTEKGKEEKEKGKHKDNGYILIILPKLR